MSSMYDGDQFAARLVMEGLADNTIRNYRCLFQRWVDYAVTMGRDPMHPDPLTVRAWAAQLSGSRSLIAQARAMIGHACRMLEVEDCSAAIPVPRQSRQPRNRGLTDLQARQLARTADRSGLAGLAVLVAMYTGARRGEVACLAWKDVDFDEGSITLTRTKVRDRLTLPMHPHLRRRLEVRWTPGERWVFPGRHGGHVAPAVIWEWCRSVAQDAHVGKVTPHMLRHTLIAEVYRLTKDLRAAQDLAGHEDPSVTAGYTFQPFDRLRAALEEVQWLDDIA